MTPSCLEAEAVRENSQLAKSFGPCPPFLPVSRVGQQPPRGCEDGSSGRGGQREKQSIWVLAVLPVLVPDCLFLELFLFREKSTPHLLKRL